MEYQNMPVSLCKLRAVAEDYATAHMEELLRDVNKGNEAIFIPNEEDVAILVPYWWYIRSFGSDVRRITEYLFEESREQSVTHSMVNLGIVDGYLSQTSWNVRRKIRDRLMEKMDGHPHAELWTTLLYHWTENQKENPTDPLWLVMARFTENRGIYLLYQNGSTRLLDGRKLIEYGLKQEDLEDETAFCSGIAMTSSQLLWMSEDDRVQWTVPADKLLELSTPVAPEKAVELLGLRHLGE